MEKANRGQRRARVGVESGNGRRATKHERGGIKPRAVREKSVFLIR